MYINPIDQFKTNIVNHYTKPSLQSWLCYYLCSQCNSEVTLITEYLRPDCIFKLSYSSVTIRQYIARGIIYFFSRHMSIMLFLRYPHLIKICKTYSLGIKSRKINLITFFMRLSSSIVANDARWWYNRRSTTEWQTRDGSMAHGRRIANITWWHHDKILTCKYSKMPVSSANSCVTYCLL